jgi:hypothetical protein
MDDVEDLVRQFSRIDIASVRMIGNVGDVEGADVGYIWEALKEVVLLKVSVNVYLDDRRNSPSLCSRWTRRALASYSFGHW